MRGVHALTLGILLATAAAAWAADKTAPSPNGLEMPPGYANWAVISVSHRLDNKTMRVILGNDAAIQAARSGRTNPWPDGAILAKVVWKEKPEAEWPEAIAPDELVHAEFMFKDSGKFAANGTGWGWARWLGPERKPFGADAGFEKDCIQCHVPVRGKDWVFTVPARMP